MNNMFMCIFSMPVGTNKYQEFVRQFLLMISSVLRKDMLPSSFTSNLVPMLSPLVANQQIKPSILFQMLCIAMWTQWRLLYSEEGECSRNEEAILEIIAAIFNAILIACKWLLNNYWKLSNLHICTSAKNTTSWARWWFPMNSYQSSSNWFANLFI